VPSFRSAFRISCVCAGDVVVLALGTFLLRLDELWHVLVSEANLVEIPAIERFESAVEILMFLETGLDLD